MLGHKENTKVSQELQMHVEARLTWKDSTDTTDKNKPEKKEERNNKKKDKESAKEIK